MHRAGPCVFKFGAGRVVINGIFAMQSLEHMNMQRNISIDLLKLALAVCVVFLHTHIFYDYSSLLEHSLVQGLFRIAVPVFLVITGYYFLYIDNFNKFKKWLKRVFILYALWMIFYCPIWWSSNLSYNISIIYNGYFVLWYLVGVLWGGGLLYCLRNLSGKKLWIIASLFFIAGVAIQQAGNLHWFSGYWDWKLNQYTTHRNFLTVSFPFMALGFLMHKYRALTIDKFDIKGWHIVILIGLVIFESLLNYFLISKKESLDQMFSLYFAAPAIVAYCLNREMLSSHKEIANLSTAIFLIHPFFIYHLKSYFIGQQTLFSFAVLLCSAAAGCLLVLMNKKVKYLL